MQVVIGVLFLNFINIFLVRSGLFFYHIYQKYLYQQENGYEFKEIKLQILRHLTNHVCNSESHFSCLILSQYEWI
jgi:hypothetical protein